MAALFANSLIQIFCDESEWILDPNVPSSI